MTFRQIPTGLHVLVDDFGFLGHLGGPKSSDNFHDRHNILLDDVVVHKDDDKTWVTGTLIRTEGGGLSMYVQGIFSTLPDTKIGKHAVSILLDDSYTFPSMPSKVLFWQVRDVFHDWRSDDMDYCFDQESTFVPFHDRAFDTLHVFEPFSGGAGGWSSAILVLRQHANLDIHVVALDADFRAVQSFALTHGCDIVDADTTLPCDLLKHCTRDIVLHGDVAMPTWWTAVAEWGVHVLTLSAPCPPWSGASHAPGLFSDQGLLLPLGMLLLRILRPLVVVIEQVKGFQSHPHKKLCLEVLRHVGYQLKWQKTCEASEFGGAKRARWLGPAVRLHDPRVAFEKFDSWPTIPQATPATLRSLLEPHQLPLPELRLTEHMLQVASEPKYVPAYLRPTTGSITPEQALELRSTSPNQVVNTIMSLYGSQHRLAVSTLETKGYLGHFLVQNHDDSRDRRLLHPAEIAMTHITHAKVFVPTDFG
eukprot:Skav228164  [mRNA]  locus=scaffold439:313918:315345:+ [translate_table: standard]